MGWREERAKALRPKPITGEGVQAEDETRQNDFKDEGGLFNPRHWIEEIENLVGEISRSDPRGGCWVWAEKNLAEKWRGLMTAIRNVDTAFEEQRADKICEQFTLVHVLYHEIVDAWNSKPETVRNS